MKKTIIIIFYSIVLLIPLQAQMALEEGTGLFHQFQNIAERHDSELPQIILPGILIEGPSNLVDLIVPFAHREEPILLEPRFSLIPNLVIPGEPITVVYADHFSQGDSFQAVLINSNGRRLARAPFFSFTQTSDGQEVKTAVLGFPTTAGSGSFIVRIEGGGAIIQDLPLEADYRAFPSERIVLDERNTEIRTTQDPQRIAESEILWAILMRTGNEIYDSGPFTSPVSSTRRTSHFGFRRVYQYVDGSTDTSIHAGIDFGVPTGTEVRSCGWGRVILARYRIVTGYSVIVEHMPGLYSLYYHLDSIIVEENELVSPETILGYSGSTGLSTGPHLHWEIRSGGENLDPDAFIAKAVLDKDEILSKLLSY